MLNLLVDTLVFIFRPDGDVYRSFNSERTEAERLCCAWYALALSSSGYW